MANRFPLTLNTSTQSIEELPAGANLDLTSSNISNIDSIQLSNTFVATNNPGQLSWNSSDGTMNIGMLNGVVQQVGQETYYYIRANTAITNGQVVMFAGAQGDHLKGDPANTSVSGFKAEYIMGIATQDITANSMGYVTSFGMVSDLNTFAFNAGDVLYLSPNTQGVLTATEPTTPNPKVSVATCVVKSSNPSATNGRIFVRPQPGSRLVDLSDVQITTPATGQGLVYNGNIWVNGNVNFANNAGNATTANTANTANTVINAAQANITSLGTLTGLTVNGVSNLSSNSNVKITGGSSGQLLSTDGTGNLSWATLSSSSISNGNSNVSITSAAGNVTFGVNGTANVVTVSNSAVLVGSTTQLPNVSISTQYDMSSIGRRVLAGPGFNWTEVNTGINTGIGGGNLNVVTYGNGLFVGVGNGNVIIYSADGTKWYSVTPPQNNNWNDIAYGNGLFVAISSNGTNRIMTSSDGVTWTLRNAASNQQWTGIAFGKGRFVVTGYVASTVMISFDGITWTENVVGGGEFNAIAYGDGMFVRASFFEGTIQTSPDGITWTGRTDPIGTFSYQNGAYGNGMFIMTTDGSTQYAYSTDNGVTWSLGTSPISSSQDIIYANGIWVIMGTGGQYATSPDGINWTLRTGLPNRGWDTVKPTYGNGRLMFLAMGNPAYALYSGQLQDNNANYGYNKFYGDWQFTSNVTSQILSVVGNANIGNINLTGNIVDSAALSIITGANGNISLQPNGTGIIIANSAVSATGNITTGNLIANTDILVGNLSVGTKIIPQNSQSADYNIVAADSGKQLFHPSADTTARTFTIPANSNVAFSVGTTITFINQASAGNISIAITTDTMRLAGNGATGTRTLAANGIATTVKITETEWIISGVNLT